MSEQEQEEMLFKFNAGNPNGIKRGLKTIQGYWKRMKVQTKKVFDSHGLKAHLHPRFLRWFQAQFRGDFKWPV